MSGLPHLDPDVAFLTFLQMLTQPTWGDAERYRAVDALAQLLRAMALEGAKPRPLQSEDPIPPYLAGYRQARRDMIAKCRTWPFRHVQTLAHALEGEERQA